MQVKIFNIRLSDEFVQIDQDKLNEFLSTVILKKSSVQLLSDEPANWSLLLFYERETDTTVINAARTETIAPKVIRKEKSIVIEHHPGNETKISFPVDSPLSSEEESRLVTLKKWRQEIADKLNLPPFMVTNNAELTTIAKLNPSAVDALNEIKGFGPNKIKKYGDEIIAVLNSVS